MFVCVLDEALEGDRRPFISCLIIVEMCDREEAEDGDMREGDKPSFECLFRMCSSTVWVNSPIIQVPLVIFKQERQTNSSSQ